MEIYPLVNSHNSGNSPFLPLLRMVAMALAFFLMAFVTDFPTTMEEFLLGFLKCDPQILHLNRVVSIINHPLGVFPHGWKPPTSINGKAPGPTHLGSDLWSSGVLGFPDQRTLDLFISAPQKWIAKFSIPEMRVFFGLNPGIFVDS